MAEISGERILAHLAQRFAVSSENVATESLTWILRRSSAAAKSVSVLVRSCGADVPDGLTFVGQVGSPDTGRPDVVGTDAEGRARVLIEAKFAAGLTTQQPVGYLDSLLPIQEPSCLLIVAPAVRLSSLWSELLRALPDQSSKAPAPSTPAMGVQKQDVGKGRVLALVSWRELIESVLDALRAAAELALVQDAEQLLALTEAMDAAAFEPVTPADFSPRIARQMHQLQHIIQDTYYRAVKGPTLEQIRNKPSHGRIFYGWNVRAVKSQKAFWFGYLPRVWSRHGVSPLWAQIAESKPWTRQRLQSALATFGHRGGSGLFDDDKAFHIPLTIEAFAGKADVVTSLVQQLDRIATCLDAAVAPGEHLEPDEPEIDVEPGGDAAEAVPPTG